MWSSLLCIICIIIQTVLLCIIHALNVTDTQTDGRQCYFSKDLSGLKLYRRLIPERSYGMAKPSLCPSSTLQKSIILWKWKTKVPGSIPAGLELLFRYAWTLNRDSGFFTILYVENQSELKCAFTKNQVYNVEFGL